MKPRLVPLQEAATALGYRTWRSLKRRAKAGKLDLTILRDGSRLVVRADELDAYLSGLRPAFRHRYTETAEDRARVASVMARL